MLGHCVDLVMDYRGLKQTWLAQRLGVTDSYVSGLLKGKFPWTEEIKNRVAHELQVPRSVLFFESECSHRLHDL
jgi:plasmid maintenance system antidote protein VapI